MQINYWKLSKNNLIKIFTNISFNIFRFNLYRKFQQIMPQSFLLLINLLITERARFPKNLYTRVAQWFQHGEKHMWNIKETSDIFWHFQSSFLFCVVPDKRFMSMSPLLIDLYRNLAELFKHKICPSFRQQVKKIKKQIFCV